MSKESTYEMLFSFSDQSPSFTYGFHCGMIWEKLELYTVPFTEMVHADYLDEVKKIATGFGFIPVVTRVSDDWFQVDFER